MVKGRRDTENDISQNTLVGDCSFRLLRSSPKSGIGRVLRHPQILMAQVRLMQSNHLYFSNSPFANDLTKRMKKHDTHSGNRLTDKRFNNYRFKCLGVASVKMKQFAARGIYTAEDLLQYELLK